jgi:hypothetical protein
MYEAIIDAILRDDFSAFEYQYLELSQVRDGPHPDSSRFDLFMFDHNGLYNLLLLKRTEMIEYLHNIDYQLMYCLVHMNLLRINEDDLFEFWSYILENRWHLKLNGEIERFVFLNIVSKHFSLLELSVRKGTHLTQFEDIGGSLYMRVITLFYNKTLEEIRKLLDDPMWREELFSIDHTNALCLLITDGYLSGDIITNIPNIIRNKKREIEECKDATLELTQLPRDVIVYCIHPYF